MGRKKGTTLSDEVKTIWRIKREVAHQQNKRTKETIFNVVVNHISNFSYEDLEKVIEVIHLLKKEKAEKEKKQLLKEKEDIEIRLQKLKNV